MAAISNDWLEYIQPEFGKEYYKELYTKVKEEYATTRIFPDSGDIFNAFHLTPLSDVRVVILGSPISDKRGVSP